MKVVTRFGEIEIGEESCITQGGLVGMSKATRFCLVNHREDSPFHWLQSLDEPAVSLAVINPMEFFSDYSFELQDADVEHLGLEDASDAVVITTVTLNEDSREVTTNLLGPIVLNKKTLSGKQVVLSSESYSTKHVLFCLKGKQEMKPEAAAA